ncbi:MAG: hypothetical protein N3A66_00080, partial [Planctomycetota bacterium]|nr:hypothetical protein [Planctomycetota bacterium]
PDEVHNPPQPGKPETERGLTVANIVSPIWRENVCGLVRAFVNWLKSTPWASRIIGFMLNAGSTEEWLIFDTQDTTRGIYHPVYTREFRRWLRRKYCDDVAALRAAWRSIEGVDFDNATCPTGHMRKGSHIWGPYSLRDPQEEQPAIDYYHFLNETLAEHLIAVCRAAKEAAATPIICGGFHSYLWWESGVYSYIQEYGHGLIQRLLASPWVDFVSDITSYDNRYPGGPSGYLGLPHSLNLHGKLHYTEVDLCTVSNLPPRWREAWRKADVSAMPPRVSEPVIPARIWNWENNYCGRDEEEQVALFQREHMHNLITGTPYWWFDIRCHNYQEPWMVETLRRLADIGRQAVAWDRGSLAQVAFICSEETPLYQAAMSGELLRFELESCHSLLLDLCTRQWGLAGIPFDIYEIHDLGHPDFPGEQYQLLIFVNCARVSSAAAAGVRRWQKEGRCFLWTYAADVYHQGRIDPSRGEELVGMRLGWRSRRQNIHVLVADNGSALTQGGSGLNFGTEGSVGPVFFVADPKAEILGYLRDSGEAAFAVRDHGEWRSIYLAMLNFGPALFRNLARFAGVHIWCDSDDVIYANRSLLCLHTASAGEKAVHLPAAAYVTDLWSGEKTPAPVREIKRSMPAFRTVLWRTEYV